MINPNATLWQDYASSSRLRGELAVKLLSMHIDLAGKKVLDAGCGSGGIALALHAHGARVTAIDPNEKQIIDLQKHNPEIECHAMTLQDLPMDSRYHVIILNDVLEHVPVPEQALSICSRALVQGGLLYIVTPNKHSIINLLCDPHYSLPLVAMMNRKHVSTIIAKWLRWHPTSKPDFPELLSFTKVRQLLEQNNFTWQFMNKEAASQAMHNPYYIWSRRWHLAVIRTIIQFKLDKIFLTFINNNPGWSNKYINPAWYILAKRK